MAHPEAPKAGVENGEPNLPLQDLLQSTLRQAVADIRTIFSPLSGHLLHVTEWQIDNLKPTSYELPFAENDQTPLVWQATKWMMESNWDPYDKYWDPEQETGKLHRDGDKVLVATVDLSTDVPRILIHMGRTERDALKNAEDVIGAIARTPITRQIIPMPEIALSARQQLGQEHSVAKRVAA